MCSRVMTEDRVRDTIAPLVTMTMWDCGKVPLYLMNDFDWPDVEDTANEVAGCELEAQDIASTHQGKRTFSLTIPPSLQPFSLCPSLHPMNFH